MLVMLNEERWQVSDDATLMEVLADVSERAASRQHLVTTLRVGERRITDRDLQPRYLDKPMREVGAVRAISEPLGALCANIRDTACRLGKELRQEGEALLAQTRAGRHDPAGLDAWLARLADFVEASLLGTDEINPASRELVSWIEELLGARGQQDLVRIADLLEYEIVPRLPASVRGVSSR